MLLHLVFYRCSSTLDLSFFMMLLSICEALLCHFDPSWWSRHIDFQVYIIKLQPGFCHDCLLNCFSHFWTFFLHDVLSNFEIATLYSPVFYVWVGTSTSRPPVYFANLETSCPWHPQKTFIDLWNCVHFFVWSLSELQNCSEFRRLHPGTWAGALKIRFWAPVAKVVLF